MGILNTYKSLARSGRIEDVDYLISCIHADMTIAQSKLIDFALGDVTAEQGVRRLEYYLFHGTQIQRNYCTLYFSRREDYAIVRKAFDMGLIDAKQAFSR